MQADMDNAECLSGDGNLQWQFSHHAQMSLKAVAALLLAISLQLYYLQCETQNPHKCVVLLEAANFGRSASGHGYAVQQLPEQQGVPEGCRLQL